MRMKRGQGRRNTMSKTNGGVITHSEPTGVIINSISAPGERFEQDVNFGLTKIWLLSGKPS